MIAADVLYTQQLTTIAGLLLAIFLTLVFIGWVIFSGAGALGNDDGETEKPEPEDPFIREKKVMEAREIDPAHPPYWTRFQPKGPTVRFCHCHHEMLTIGQRVLLFPIPGSDGTAFEIFCEDSIEADGA